MDKKTKRLIAFALCLCLCLVMVFTFRYMILESNHHCTGADCPICLEIHFCASLHNTIGSGIVHPVVLFIAALALAGEKFFCSLFIEWYHTLVSLKVKLSD